MNEPRAALLLHDARLDPRVQTDPGRGQRTVVPDTLVLACRAGGFKEPSRAPTGPFEAKPYPCPRNDPKPMRLERIGKLVASQGLEPRTKGL